MFLDKIFNPKKSVFLIIFLSNWKLTMACNIVDNKERTDDFDEDNDTKF